MSKRTQPYKYGIPKKYSDKSQGKKDSKTSTERAVELVKEGQKAAETGEDLPDSYFKERTMKKGGKVARKALSAATKKTLQAKAKKSGISYGKLAQVYRRGQGAYLSSGSKNVSMDAWSRGRVNSFVSGKGGARKADKDLMKGSKK